MTDASDIAFALNNKRVQDNLRDGIPYPYTVADAEAYISAMLNAEKSSVYAWAITADWKVVGSIGVFRKENIHRQTAEMGYYLGEPWWGRGIGTIAVREACDYIFRNTDIIRIYAEPFAFNTASCRVLEKAGFSQEGILRQNAVKNGVTIDMKLFARIKD